MGTASTKDSGRRFVGKILTPIAGEHFCFIDKETVTAADGGEHRVAFTSDIFLHRDDCQSFSLSKDLEVEFGIAPNERKPGRGNYRATNAQIVLQAELVPAQGDVLPGLSKAMELVRGRDTRHIAMKSMAMEAVALALQNAPLTSIPRPGDGESGVMRTDDDVRAGLAGKLLIMFPQLQSLGISHGVVGYDETAQDKLVAEAMDTYNSLGMKDMITEMTELYKRFKATRRLLRWIYEQGWFKPGANLTPAVVTALFQLVESTIQSGAKDGVITTAQGVIKFMADEGLLGPTTVIPNEHLPELFLSAPVCYFALTGQEQRDADIRMSRRGTNNPAVHAATKDLCEVLPGNQRWADLVQLYNRRCRPLTTYVGDAMPATVAQLITRASKVFDRVIVLTPYHDVAGEDWGDLTWLRPIDPYVIGVKKGLPCFFFLARFSDTGIFPLLEEMLADTTNFLDTNKGKLANFNGEHLEEYFSWHVAKGDRHHVERLGHYLTRFVDELLKAYKAGRVFDWVRGTYDNPVGGLAARETTKK